MNLTFFILFDFSFLHNAYSSFFPPSPIFYHLLSLWPSQNSNEIKWFACTYRILHVHCLLLKAWRRGWWWCWWASMCSDIDIKQSSDMEMGGQGKNGSSLRLCLDVGQGLSLPLSQSLCFSHTFFLSSPMSFPFFPAIVHPIYLNFFSFILPLF